MYKLLYQLYVKNIFESPWITHVKYILNSIGLSNLWLNQEIVNLKWFKVVVKLKITDQYHQQWGSNICNSDGCTTYRIIKYDFKMEKYLLVLPPNLSRPLCKFRTCNHRLPIQQGRYSGIDRHERYCTLCDCNGIGDEFHYLFKCTFFQEARLKFISRYYFVRPNTLKMDQLFNLKSHAKLIKLCKFVQEILNSFKL